MLLTLSPAKTLDFETPSLLGDHSRPQFLRDAAELVDELRDYSGARLGRLMSLSATLAETNRERYASWKRRYDAKGAKQAVLAFKGDVYVGLDAERFDRGDFDFAQEHLRILSGLYGVLRPLDLIQPHRLEMGTRLRTARGKDLYAFWGDKITEALNRALAEQGDAVLVNVASNEYFKAIHPNRLAARVVTPVFQDWKNGAYRTISFFAKKARGMFARFVIRNRVDTVDALADFTDGGYAWSQERSNGDRLVFTRD